jgi:hypothetical protein
VGTVGAKADQGQEGGVLHYESIEWIKRPIDSIVRLYWLSNMLYMNSYKWLLNLVCKP